MLTVYVNVIGSGRHEGYEAAAYVDFAIRGKVKWPRDGSVFRIMLPRAIFRKTHCFRFGSKSIV